MLIGSLIRFIIVIIVLGLIFYLLKWAIDNVGLPEPFHKVAMVCLIVVAVLILLSLLLSVLGLATVVVI